jgi:hypothetical protein
MDCPGPTSQQRLRVADSYRSDDYLAGAHAYPDLDRRYVGIAHPCGVGADRLLHRDSSFERERCMLVAIAIGSEQRQHSVACHLRHDAMMQPDRIHH